MVGLPGFVVGNRRPTSQTVAGALLALSTAAIIWAGFSGTITVIVSPMLLAIEAAAFYFFGLFA